MATDKYGNNYPATVCSLDIEEVQAPSASPSSSLSRGEDASVGTDAPSAGHVHVRKDRAEEVIVRAEVHFDAFRLQYNEILVANSREVEQALADDAAAEQSRAEYYGRGYQSSSSQKKYYAGPHSFHPQIRRLAPPTPGGSAAAHSKPLRYWLVPVMHHEQTSKRQTQAAGDAAQSAADEQATTSRHPSHKSFGTPFVVAISSAASFAEAHAAVVAEARRFVDTAAWQASVNPQGSAASVQTEGQLQPVVEAELPFRVVMADAKGAGIGSSRNPRKFQALPFELPRTHVGRICVGEVDDLKLDEKFILVWSDRRFYAKDQDHPNGLEGAAPEGSTQAGGQSPRRASMGRSPSEEEASALGLEGAEVMSIAGSLNRLFAPEKLPEDYKCDRCSAKGTCARQMSLWTLPDYLVIQIKRFE